MTISVYKCEAGVFFIRCAPANRYASPPPYRAEAYRALRGRTLQQVVEGDGRPVEAHGSTVSEAATRLIEALQACLGSPLELAPGFPTEGYVLHGAWSLPRAYTSVSS